MISRPAALFILLCAVGGSAQTLPSMVRETAARTFPEGQEMPLKFQGTPRLPKAHGYATVEHKKGTTEIEMRSKNMKPASLFGGDFSTYVLWVVSPEGLVQNAGEFELEADESTLDVSTNLSAFGMFVTAEPHYLVSLPSRFVVLETTKTGYRTTTIQYR